MQKPPLLTPLTAALALALTAGCAPSGAADASADADAQALLDRLDTSRSCFTQREVRGYANAPDGPGNSERILVDTGPREEFLLETLGPCPDLDATLRLTIRSRQLSQICTGELADVVLPSTIAGDFNRCTVRVLGRITPEA